MDKTYRLIGGDRSGEFVTMPASFRELRMARLDSPSEFFALPLPQHIEVPVLEDRYEVRTLVISARQMMAIPGAGQIESDVRLTVRCLVLDTLSTEDANGRVSRFYHKERGVLLQAAKDAVRNVWLEGVR